ncbi:MAG: hypothetical protein HQ475_08530 [SAR202 cluster bacterium]|nr:hypothetical protein [SAR202 cluster bacterium]
MHTKRIGKAGKTGVQLAFAILLLMGALWLIAPPAYAHEGEHDSDCGGPEIIIEGGQPASFSLPSQAGGTIEIDPDAVLTIRGENLPADASMHWGLQGLGTELAGEDVQFTSGVTTINVAEFSAQARGIYEVEGTLLSGPVELCTIPFNVNISGFGGTTAYTATGVAAVAGIGALAAAPLAANGLSAKLNAKVQVARRRPRGWRRWIPIPAWKRSIFSTLVGAVTGLGLAVLMQQTGYSPLTLASAVWGLILGGGVSFGVGYSLGVIKTFVKPPLEN